MKKLILLIILIISLNTALLAEWENIDNINKSLPFINNIELYGNDLIVSSQNSIYVYDRIFNEWDLLNNDNITEQDSYSYLYAKGDTIIAHSTKKGTFLSTNSGVTWSGTTLLSGINGLSDYQSNDDYSFALGVIGISRTKKGEFKWENLTVPDEDAFISMSVRDSIVALSNKTYTIMGGEIIKGGIFISKDNGNTFTKYFGLVSIKQIEITEDNTIIAMSDSKLYKSENHGANWEVKDMGSTSKFFEYLDKELFVFTEENEIIKYDIGLNKLDRFTQGNGNKVKQLSCSHGIEKKLFIGTWSGVYELDTETMTMKLNSPSGSNTNLFYIRNIENNLYYSGFDLGLNYSTNGAKSWNNFNSSLDSIDKSASRFDRKGDLAIGSNYISYPLYTTNNLRDWDVVSDNRFGVILNVGIIENSFYITTKKGLFTKTDSDTIWNKSESLKTEKNYDVVITSSLDHNNTLFIGSDGDGLYKSTDVGKTWNKSEFEDELYDFSIISQIYKYKNEIGLIMKFVDNVNYIYSYDIEKNKWTKKGDLGNKEIKRAKLYGNSIFFTTTDGISYSNDYGKTVNLIIDGLDESDIPYINDFTFHDGFIYIANSNGMYRRPLSEFGITSVESEIEQNTLVTSPPYPQPARSAVTIEFGNYTLSKQDITIYNIEGGEIKNQVITINNNSLTWDCSAALPGIYLINIKHGTEEKSVKVVVE